MALIYGIKTKNGEHIDVSLSERAKRSLSHYYVAEYAKKVDGKWRYIDNAENILTTRTR